MLKKTTPILIFFLGTTLFFGSNLLAQLCTSYECELQTNAILKNFSLLLAPVLLLSFLFIFFSTKLMKIWLLLTLVWLIPSTYLVSMASVRSANVLNNGGLTYAALCGFYCVASAIVFGIYFLAKRNKQ